MSTQPTTSKRRQEIGGRSLLQPQPTLIRTQPWMNGPHAAAVKASIAAHDPQAHRTIHDAEVELVTVEAALGAEEPR